MKTFFSSEDRSRTIDASRRRPRRERPRAQRPLSRSRRARLALCGRTTFGARARPAAVGQDVRTAHPERAVRVGAVVTTSTKPDVLDATLATRWSGGTCHLFDPSGSVADRPGVHRLRWSPLPACTSWRTALMTARSLVVVGRRVPGRPRPGPPLDRAGPGTAGAAAARRGARGRGHAHRAGLGGPPPGPARPAGPGVRWRCGHRPGPPRRHRHDRRARAQRHLVDGVGCPGCLPVGTGTGRHLRSRLRPWRLRRLGRHRVHRRPGPSSGAGGAAGGGPDRRRPPCRLRPGRRWAAGSRAPVLLALDELANIAPLPELPSMVSEGGGQGLVTLACFQDLSQARHRWPGRPTASPRCSGRRWCCPASATSAPSRPCRCSPVTTRSSSDRCRVAGHPPDRPLTDLLGRGRTQTGEQFGTQWRRRLPRTTSPRSPRPRPGVRRT